LATPLKGEYPAHDRGDTTQTGGDIMTVDPESYLRDVINRIADHQINRIAELLPWNWRPTG